MLVEGVAGEGVTLAVGESIFTPEIGTVFSSGSALFPSVFSVSEGVS